GLGDKKAVVAVFLSFECPVSTGYSQLLAGLARTYGERGVAFVGFVPNTDEDAAGVARQAREFRLPFPVLKDERGAADAFKAELTPEAFVLDSHFVLRYRGRIDNGYAARLKRNVQVTEHNLRQALDDLLAGQPVRTPATQAVGCPISRDTETRAATGSV